MGFIDEKDANCTMAFILIRLSGWLVIFIPIRVFLWYLDRAIALYLLYGNSRDFTGFAVSGLIPVVFVSLVFLPLGIGVWRHNKICRIISIYLLVFMTVFPFFVPASRPSFLYFVKNNPYILYSFFLLIILNLPQVKNNF